MDSAPAHGTEPVDHRERLVFEPPADTLDYVDYPKVREYFLDSVKTSMSSVPPTSNDRFRLEVRDVDYSGKPPTIRDEQSAIRAGKSLTRRLTGRYALTDLQTGRETTTNRRTLMNVPWMTKYGFYNINGVPYSMARQFRMDPGLYARVADDGVAESQFNVAQGTGMSFRLRLDPKSGVFTTRIAGKGVPLYRLLSRMGVKDETMRSAWGQRLFAKNRGKKPHASAVGWLNRTIERERESMVKAGADPGDVDDKSALVAYFERMRLNPENTKRLTGHEYSRVSPGVLLTESSRVLDVANGRAPSDKRDNPSNQRLFDEGDHMAAYLALDRGGVFRTALWKMRNDPERLARIPSGLFDQHVGHHLNEAGLSQTLEQTNPLDAFIQAHRVTRLGEGAISSIDSAPAEARQVQSGYFSFIDPIKSVESMKIGLDMYLARTVVKGPDNKLYSRFRNTRTGGIEWLNPVQIENEFIGNPGSSQSRDKSIAALSPRHGLQYLPKSKVNYELVDGDDLFSMGSDSIDMKSGVKGMRQLMGAKYLGQALPVIGGEAPLVQTPTRGGELFSDHMGQYVGAVKSQVDGIVTAVGRNGATVVDANGGEHESTWYDWIPFARKTYLKQTPMVKVGDKVGKGTLLAKSNYTDDRGRMALGRNLRVGFMAYRGFNTDDAVVISESTARDKLRSDHMYIHKYEPEDGIEITRKRFEGLFPVVFTREQLGGIDDTGVVRKGARVRRGDPLVLAVGSPTPGKATMGRRMNTDRSELWEREDPGVVRDVIRDKRGVRIFVESEHGMRVGDKLATSHGSKGTVALILPDGQMPRDSQGRPLEILISPLSVPSRTNPSIVSASKLGKVAAKTGKPYVIGGYTDESLIELAEQELGKHGIQDKEDLLDPVTGRTIPEVGTGLLHVYKMQQEAEAKGHARETGGYSMDESPSRGSGMSAKHYGDMEQSALLAGGATEVLKDFSTIHGQANPDFWRQVKLGGTPAMARTPLVYDKFRDLVRASGVTLREGTSKGDQVFAATDADIVKLTGHRRIQNGMTYNRQMKPVASGLFDPESTGSTGAGERFSYIKLPEPMLNPLMEPMARHLLGLKKSELEDISEGRRPVSGKVGGEALSHMLSQISVKSLVKSAKDIMKNGTSATARDAAAKRLMYAQAMDDRDLKPVDFMMTRVPVLPPRHRRVVEQGDRLVVPDLNYMYKRLIQAVDDFGEAGDLGPEAVADARSQMVQAYRAVVGVTPPGDKDLQAKKVGGVLQQLLSKGSPKHGFTQRRVLGFNVDLSALGVAVPNPALKMNQVGIPEEYAWSVYGPFVIRQMVTGGRPAMAAARAVQNRSEDARAALAAVIRDRPVTINRAPTLHRYGISAFDPVLVAGRAIQVNPQVAGPFGLDYDGNCLDFDERLFLRFSKSVLDKIKSLVYVAGVDPQDVDPDSKDGIRMLEAQMHVNMKTDVSVEIPIGNFPRVGVPMKDKNGADVYEVPAGVTTLSYDVATGKSVFALVTHYTVEHDCECVDVKYGARHLVVSSNESLAVFDHETGSLAKMAPADAVGMLSPRLGDMPGPKGDYGTRDFGWWVGAFVSDGWVSGRTVGHSKLSDEISGKFARLTESLLSSDFKRYEYSGKKEDGHFGRSRKAHYNSSELADTVRSYGFYNEARDSDDTGARSARFKQIPPAMLARGSDEFLWGVVSGLVDGDSCMSVNKTFKNDRFYARFNTSSPWLKNGIVNLFLRLGIQCSVTEIPARGKSAVSWVVIPATHSLQKSLSHIECASGETREFLEAWDKSGLGIGSRADVIPMTLDEAEEFRAMSLADKDTSAYSAVMKSKKAPRAHRAVVLRVLSRHAGALEGVRLRAESSVTWESVSKVSPAGVRDVFDIAVEGTKVFATTAGLIVYDTMSFTVPVSQAAVKEARAKLMPTSNLLSRHSGQPHYAPSQETHSGLYMMTRNPKSRAVRVFESKADMLQALGKGDIDVDDPVQIKENE